MAIISVNERAGYSGYRKTQFRYATTYIIITLIVLVILNIYCSITCQKLFYQSKRESMIEKCLLISDEIATLDVLNNTSIATVIGQMESLKVTRLIVTDQSAKVLYDMMYAPGSTGTEPQTHGLQPRLYITEPLSAVSI